MRTIKTLPLILSYDTIMGRPPYEITPSILKLIASISELLGAINASHLYKPVAELRRKNRIKTIHASLAIEGNALTEEQVTDVLNDKRVLAPEKDLREVKNAIEVYDKLNEFDPNDFSDLLGAHGILMRGLTENPGKLRTKNVGIVQGKDLKHMAPKGEMVYGLMMELMQYLETHEAMPLIKSCVFHYELEYIHPFMDGNGRMGRLWQTLILVRQNPVFAYLPVETIVKNNQAEYYRALGESDRSGHSTPFLGFMLRNIQTALEQVLATRKRPLTTTDRLEIFQEKTGSMEFSRKDYLEHFRNISAPTASRDLKKGVDTGILFKSGQKNQTTYRFGSA